MKKLVLCSAVMIVFLITALLTDAQTTFKITLTNLLTDEVVDDALELNDGSFIFACVQYNPYPNIKGHLFKLSKSGKLIGDTIYTYQNQNSGTFSILQTSSNKYLFASYALDESNHFVIWLFQTDSTFKKIDEKIIPLDTNSLVTLACEIQESGNILINGILMTPSHKRYAFIYELTPTYDSLQCKIFTDKEEWFQPSLLRKNNNEGYYFFLIGYLGPTSGFNEAILNLDNSFSILSISGVPLGVWGSPNSRWINTKNFILTGRKDNNSEFDRGIEGLILDTNFNLYHNLFIGTHDTIEWQALWRNLDFNNPDSIYIGGTHNMCEWEYCNTVSWYSLSSTDSVLNLRWQKFYGDSADYTLYGLKATKDGGCILYGTVYDSATMTNERDVCVIKVDKNGLISGINDINNRLVHDVIVYPNPGSDYLTIECGPQVSGSQFILYNTEGKPILQQFLKNRKTILDTHLVQPGNYIWQLEYQGKTIETGKWIKAG